MFGMSSVNDTPPTDIFPEASQDSDSLQRRRILLNAVDTVMEKYVKFSMTEGKRKMMGGEMVSVSMHRRSYRWGCFTWSSMTQYEKGMENAYCVVDDTFCCCLSQQGERTTP